MIAKKKGDFGQRAEICQVFKTNLRNTPFWDDLPAVQREAMDGIMDKLSIILNGGNNEPKNWINVAGYVNLVTNILPKEPANQSNLSTSDWQEEIRHGNLGR